MILEPNNIYLGDCLELMPYLPDNSIDLIYADLPFGSTQNKWDIIIPFESLWAQYKRIIKPNGAVVLHAAEPFASMLRLSNLDWFKYDWIWDKRHPTGQLNAKKQPLRQHELVCVFYDKQCTYNPRFHVNRLKRSFVGKVEKENKQSDNYGQQYNYDSNITDESLSYPRSIISQTTVIGNSKEKLPHATQKPVALAEYFITTYSNEGDVVLDNCVGSGTTVEACINTNRQYIAMEKKLFNYDMATKRVASNRKNLQLDLFKYAL